MLKALISVFYMKNFSWSTLFSLSHYNKSITVMSQKKYAFSENEIYFIPLKTHLQKMYKLEDFRNKRKIIFYFIFVTTTPVMANPSGRAV
jgi:hypothetical protein